MSKIEFLQQHLMIPQI